MKINKSGLISVLLVTIIIGFFKSLIDKEIKKQDEEIKEQTEEFARNLVQEAFPVPDFTKRA